MRTSSIGRDDDAPRSTATQLESAGRAVAHATPTTMMAMYFDALSFLEDEREAWRPFEALDDLSDEELQRPVEAAHGWSGRDLMGHLVAWQEVSLATAQELAIGEQSATKERMDPKRTTDEIDDEFLAAWRARPLDELRERFRTVPGELRGYLTVVPEVRWIKNAAHQESFFGDTIDHYEEHAADLRAILANAGR